MLILKMAYKPPRLSMESLPLDLTSCGPLVALWASVLGTGTEAGPEAVKERMGRDVGDRQPRKMPLGVLL